MLIRANNWAHPELESSRGLGLVLLACWVLVLFVFSVVLVQFWVLLVISVHSVGSGVSSEMFPAIFHLLLLLEPLGLE